MRQKRHNELMLSFGDEIPGAGATETCATETCAKDIGVIDIGAPGAEMLNARMLGAGEPGSEALQAGCDEAGRGCLAGPVFAAAVILPRDFDCTGLDDSKKLTERQRERLRPQIENGALAWAVASVDPGRIDEINILNASFEAMNLAVEALVMRPQMLLIDGNRFRTTSDIPYRCIVGGDGKYAAIAAASILAKTHRDQYMHSLAAQYPEYGWERNAGYPTALHRQAILRLGPTPHHRVTFLRKLK